MAAEAGFDVKVVQMEFASGLDAADRGDFEAYLIGWSGRADADGNIWNFLHTGGPLNYGAYSNKDMDAWLDGARATTDLAARKALYAKVAALAREGPAAALPLLAAARSPACRRSLAASARCPTG